MNYAEAPSDNAEVQRLLRECDSLGADSALWLRAFRQLIKGGKPIGQLLAFTIPIGDDKRIPLGILTLTDRNRLVFWPVLPRRPCVVINKPRAKLPDHITVELPSEKVHATSYSSSGRPMHMREGWRSAPLQRPDFRLLFTFLVRMSVVAEQDVLIGRKYRMPTRDSQRRKKEFARCASRVVFQHLPVPENVGEHQYVYFASYCAPQDITLETLPSSLLPKSVTAGMVTGWPDHTEFPITVGQFSIRQRGFCMAAGFPPGQLHDELCFGFPQRSTRDQPTAIATWRHAQEKKEGEMKWQDRVSIKPDVCHGKACIKGTRVMVSVILANLAEGESHESIMSNYHVNAEDIQAAILFAADMAEDRFLPLGQETV